jgi:glycerophosphoryl diester phosphodiesterase
MAPNYTLVDSGLVEKAHSEGMQIVPWTVNEYEDMVRLIGLGVDGILSDYPNHFRKIRDLQVKQK